MALLSHDVRSGLETAHGASELPEIGSLQSQLTFFLRAPEDAPDFDVRTIGPRYEHISAKLMSENLLILIDGKTHSMFCA